MLIAYWAAKGGSGATVLAAAHGLQQAASRPTVLVDLDGDLPTVLGVAAPKAGISDWMAAGPEVPTDALERIADPVAPNLHLLGRGTTPDTNPLDPERLAVLVELLAGSSRTVIADCGSLPGPLGAAIARSAHRSILVTRPCFLALRRQRSVGLAPTEIAVVRDGGRAFTDGDIERAIGAPVRVSVTVDPAIASAVDAGVLTRRLPRPLRRAADRAVGAVDDAAHRRGPDGALHSPHPPGTMRRRTGVA